MKTTSTKSHKAPYRNMPRLKAIYEFIDGYIKQNGWPPSKREIAQQFGGVSTSVVDYWTSRMEEYNMLKREFNVARGIKLLPYTFEKESDHVRTGNPA